MKEHTKSYVSLLTLFVTLVIFIQTNVLTIMIFGLKGETRQVVQVTKDEEIAMREEVKEWKIKIPKIGLSTNITEGTEEEIINHAVGHFTSTPWLEGNVGLVAGCDGYQENYFAGLEQLELGDVILYQYGEDKKEYKVTINQIIDQKDWSYLTATEENKLTLITGVMNEPEKRRCVQAEEII